MTEACIAAGIAVAEAGGKLKKFTPLRAINGYSTILLEDHINDLNEDGVKSLNQIITNAKKMSNLISDLLHLSQVSRKELKKHTVKIDTIINSILVDMSKTINGRNIEFKINSMVPALADENLIKQVWFNLISNAIKYTQLKENASIEIGSNSKEKEIIYYIKDNGIGFDMKYADKLFGVFQRLHPSKDFEGTGVGLAIAKRIVQKHGGKIWADSKVNNGTTFYFTLPNN